MFGQAAPAPVPSLHIQLCLLQLHRSPQMMWVSSLAFSQRIDAFRCSLHRDLHPRIQIPSSAIWTLPRTFGTSPPVSVDYYVHQDSSYALVAHAFFVKCHMALKHDEKYLWYSLRWFGDSLFEWKELRRTWDTRAQSLGSGPLPLQKRGCLIVALRSAGPTERSTSEQAGAWELTRIFAFLRVLQIVQSFGSSCYEEAECLLGNDQTILALRFWGLCVPSLALCKACGLLEPEMVTTSLSPLSVIHPIFPYLFYLLIILIIISLFF